MITLLHEVFVTYRAIAPYLMFGLAIAGILHVFFKKDFIIRHLGKNNFWSVLKASLLGVPLPLCSCGVIPTAMYLRRKKASRGATLSFLISTPQTGIDSIIATYGMLGPIFALFRPLAAFITGIVGGSVANFIYRKELDPEQDMDKGFHCDTCTVSVPHVHSFRDKVKSGFIYAYRDFLDDISLQLLIGIFIAGMISFFIPDDFFSEYGGQGLTGMFYMILLGLPLYVCATASIPIAVSLLMKGISPGAAFVFLVVGPATNAAAIALISNSLGKKATVIYLLVISVFAILSGLLLNLIFSASGSRPLHNMLHDHGSSTILSNILMVMFSGALFLSLFRKFRVILGKRSKESIMEHKTRKFKIEGMTCNHCVMTVTRVIKELPGVEKVTVDLESGYAFVTGDVSTDLIRKSVEGVGYKLVNE
ncbi:MAG: SO_0444 family Cu/Zn efflux transporter [Candidatus Cloacimonetes bacterium]|nr:SO_0444 family Cu/Zn efflux transporter [Candidatus Cloacimonadota bacterium]